MATQASGFFESEPRFTSAERFASIVQRAHALTNASGAATAIREDNSSNFVCRASSGSSAPKVGTPLRLEGTFTGMCIQSGKELICDDAETDARVDTSAIRALGIRSIAVAPIKEDRRVIGVLAVFSPKPHAFTTPLVGVLNALADQITAVLRKERQGKEDRRIEPALNLTKPSASPTPPPALIVLTPAESSAAPKTPESEEPASLSTPAAPKDDSIWATPEASAIAPAMLVLEEAEKLEQKGAEVTPPDHPRPDPSWEQVVSSIRADLNNADAIPEKHESPRANKLIVIGSIIAVLALAASIIVFLTIRNRSSAIPVQSSERQEGSALSAPPAPVASGPAPKSGRALSGPKPDTVAKSSKNKRSEGAGKTEQQSKSDAAIIPAETLSDSKIANLSGSSQNESPDNIALPSGLGSSSGPDLSSLARPVSSSPPAMVVPSALINARVIHRVPPLYPDFAKASQIVGAVIVKVTVKKDGKVANPKVKSGPGVLRAAALDAVKQWRFKPAMLNGQPIEQDTEITLNFKP